MKQGRLKYRYPNCAHSVCQKYVVAEAEFPIISEENIIEFCNIPRSKDEIKKHFEMSKWVGRRYINQLVENGKLVYTDYTRVGKTNTHGRLMKNG